MRNKPQTHFICIHLFIQKQLQMFYILNHDSQICLKTTYDPSTSVKWGQQCGPGCADKGNTEPLTFTAHNRHPFYIAMTWISSTTLRSETEVSL